jgi:hypothetical protein
MPIRMHTITALTAATLITLAGCSSGASTTDTNSTTSQQASDSAEKETAAKDAEQVVQSVAQTVANAKLATVYTADSDPNKLLGRPGGYTSKADFTDDRAKPDLDDEVQKGGSVEVYEDPADAKERADFIASTLKKMKIFGTEYHYLNGGILLRVSGELTPDEAAAYETALSKLS